MRLTLTPPPTERAAGTIANVELRCDELGFHQPIALPPLADPFTPAEREELTWYLETYWQWPYEEFARRGQRVEQLLTEAGQRLYQAVFGSAQAMAVVQPWRLLTDAARQLSIISTVPQSLGLPWELLCDEQGFLALRTKNPISIIRRLPQMLQDSGVRLAVLTACQSAKSASNDLFSSVAARLIRSGVDAVVAMSASVLVVSAAKYVEAFYRRLAAGEAVTLAHERARQALHDNPERHLHQRRRDEAGTAVKLKDWWLPHFYQQRPLTFVVPPSGGSAQFQALPAEAGTTNSSLPPAPRYGFTGRARELHRIERWLLRGSAVVVHGFGGMGKTAIAREAADWLTGTWMYAAACFVSFEHGGDAAMLLSALGHRLGVDFDSRETDAALGHLRVALKQRPTLVIADNLESILPGGDAPLDAEAHTQLWDVLLQLGKAGAGVIITSRDAEFGDGRMAHGKEVKHLPLGGLHPEDAYALAVQLFKDLDIARSRAPYPKLRDLLVQLDHLPLAIQLVLPALGEAGMIIDRLSAEFAALLPRFTDDRETGRNRCAVRAGIVRALSDAPSTGALSASRRASRFSGNAAASAGGNRIAADGAAGKSELRPAAWRSADRFGPRVDRSGQL